MSDRPKSYLDRLLDTSVILLLSALALSWAWRLLAPLVPVLIGLGVTVGSLSIVRWWRSYW